MNNKHINESKSTDQGDAKYSSFKTYNPKGLVKVGFCCQQEEPNDEEIYHMVDADKGCSGFSRFRCTGHCCIGVGRL